jgi:hypothetical protein
VQGFDHGASDKSGSPGDENSRPIHFILPLKINRINWSDTQPPTGQPRRCAKGRYYITVVSDFAMQKTRGWFLGFDVQSLGVAR